MGQLKIWEKNTIGTDRPEISDQREQLRRSIRKWRQQLTPEMVTERSGRLVTHLKTFMMNWPGWEDCEVFLCYASFRNEVSLDDYYRFLLSAGKKICFPRTKNGQMEFYFVEQPQQDLHVGAFGIREPEPFNCFDGTQKAVALVPGVVFDLQRNRLGYGGGYYDRYLGEHRDITTIGICYEGQLVPKLECAGWDIAMDALVTEKRVICERSQPWN